MTGSRDTFSYRVVLYAACFFLAYKGLFQLSYVDHLSKIWFVAIALVLVHVIGWLWCVGASLFSRGPRRLATFVCAGALVIALQWLSPDAMKVHFWLHKDEYLARIAAASPARDGRISLVLFSYGDDIPSMPGGNVCATEIVYDDSKNIDHVSRSAHGRALVENIDEGFYLRYPPCE